MRERAVHYLLRVGIQKIIGFLLYAAGAGFVLTAAGIIYFVYLFIATAVIGLILLKSNDETLAERGKVNTDSPKWDKILLFIFWLLNYFVVYLLAGVSEKAEHLDAWFWVGIVISIVTAWFSTWATLVNTFLESTARIQTDRNQTVCSTGPYRIVRHPAYSGLILNGIGVCMIFPYVSVWICTAVTVFIIVVRTAKEDKMLQDGLAGYTAYSQKTRYRLIPYIW